MKKFLLFAAALCFSATMFAQDIFTDDQGLYYEVIYEDDVDTGNCQIIACQEEGENYEGEITIPAAVSYNGKEYNVTRVDAWAFNGASIEGELTIPGTLLALGKGAFNACTGLTRVTIEYSETPLEEENNELYCSSFNGCDNVTTVLLYRDVDVTGGSGAFSTFAYVEGIKTVYIGSQVTEIPHHMFRSNKGLSLETVYSDAANPPSIDDTTFEHHNASTFVFYTKADYLNTYKADKVWVKQFTKAYMHAYDGEDPEEPANENAFQDEQGLWYEIIFDEEDNPTENCQMIAPPVQAEDQVYSGSITIPATVTNDGTEYNVTRIDTSAFDGAQISGYLTIPGTIMNVGASAFANCTNIIKVTYEYAADPIFDENDANGTGGYSFSGAGVEWVVLNRDMTVGNTGRLCPPFCYNTTVNTVEIGEAVTTIPAYMFRNTNNPCLRCVTCYATTPPELGANVFDNLPSDDDGTVLYVYKDYISTYEDSAWGDVGFSQILPIEDVPEGITDLKAETSAKVSGLYNVAGQRVNENAKGLLIKDGKKVLVK